jgi:serine/threonine-protein kinase
MLLTSLTEGLRRGEQPDFDAIVQQHPDVADELRELLAMSQLADELAPATIDQPTLVSEGASPGPSDSTNVPREFGNYEILEELGRGGMGVVYKARQRSPDRLVALKMILRGDLASNDDLLRFRGEAQSAARLEGHPNIVPVHEVAEWNGQPYFSMKYVEGTTLAKLVAQRPLKPRDAARYVAIIARAVHHAHEQGILHRDLKPSNILIDGHDQPHVTDFGLAKRVESNGSLTQAGAIVGTPSYMSPEQATGNRGRLSPASDVYSLGAVLYELLTGRPPFQAPSAVDTIMQVLEQEVVPPRLLNPRVDRDLEIICLKCLQKPASLRYASAAMLAEDLEAFLQGERISTRPLSVVDFVGRMLSETHHAAVLENWGLLWMWHSLVLVILCALTNIFRLQNVQSVYPYLGIWGLGAGTWAAIFWALRRRAGPVTFVERQIAHVWAASMIGSVSLFWIELFLHEPVLTLSPVLAVLAGMVFLVKAGALSGSFYLVAPANFLTALLMALWPTYALFLFGLVSGLSFFIPGLKYYRQRAKSLRCDGEYPTNDAGCQ